MYVDMVPFLAYRNGERSAAHDLTALLVNKTQSITPAKALEESSLPLSDSAYSTGAGKIKQ